MRLPTTFSVLFFIAAFNLLQAFEVKAQITLTGSVLDENQSPLPSATVLLLELTDSTLVKGNVTDSEGVYRFENLQPDTYLISVSMVGFQKQVTNPIRVDDEWVEVPDITLQEAIEQMGEVSVTAQRPLFEQQIDRMVVNVQQSITAAGSSVLETLEKSPGIQVNRQNGNISMNGRTGVRVMINDRPVNLPADAVVQMLNGMSSANVEQIELISNPPARYEAEGDAGIINIKMTEHTDIGYTGTVGGNLGYNWAEIIGGNLNFSKRGRNIAYFINYSVNYDRNKQIATNDRFLKQNKFTQFSRNTSLRWPVTSVQNLSAGLEYSITPQTTAGISFSGYRRKWQLESLSETHIQQSPANDLISEMDLNETNLWRNVLSNVNLHHSFSENKNLQFNFDYLYYINENPSFYDNNFVGGNQSLMEIHGIDVTKHTPIHFWVSKIDYQDRLSDKLTLETGLKGTINTFLNDISVSQNIDGNWIPSNRYSNEADLTEKYGAVYLSTDWNATDDFRINAGLRYEYMDSFLSTPHQPGLIDRQNGFLFPSLFIEKQFTDTKSLGLAYSRRITRPTFNDMAPFVFFVTPNTFWSGNPALKSAISDGLRLDYQYNHWLISLQYSHADDAIGQWQSRVDPETNEQIYMAENLDYIRTYSITTSFPLELSSWWDIQTNITGRYQEIKSNHLGFEKSDDAAGFTLDMTNTISLPREFTFEISGNYVSKESWGFQHLRPRGALNIGLQKSLFDGQGILRLSGTDVLATDNWRLDGDGIQENIETVFTYDWYARSINLTFTWNFGNNDIDAVNLETGSAEEQERVN